MRKYLWLQLFADGGDGGGDGGAAASNASPTAEGDSLEALGVPHELAERHREFVSKSGKATAPETAAATPAQTKTTPTPEAPSRKSWDELMQDPEYNKEMQRTVQTRLKSAKDAESKLSTLAPVMEVLASKYGLDPDNLDYNALAKAVADDESYYEDKALELGVPVSTAKRIAQTERETARQQRREQETIEEQKIRNHFNSLVQQAEELKKLYPDFDLERELQNENFVRLTGPDSGLKVKDAYFAVHADELMTGAMASATRQASAMMANSIRSGKSRPAESGTSGNRAPGSNTTIGFDISRATAERQRACIQWVQEGYARGEMRKPSDFPG